MSAHGTWKTTGGGDYTLVVVVIAGAVIICSGALTAAITALTALVTVVFIAAAVLAVAAGAVGYVLWRRHQRLPSVPDQIAAAREFRAAEQLRVMQQRPARQIAAPGQHLHYHYHAAPGQPDLSVLRQALPGSEQR